MAVEVKDVRKVVVIDWDTTVVVGRTASVQADGKELRVVANRGYTNIFYPLDWTGSTDVTVKGSARGEDTGTIEVTGQEESGGIDGPSGGEEDTMTNATDFVVVSDERDGGRLREFVGIALDDSSGVGDTIPVQVNVDEQDNGFGWDVGVSVQFLKEIREGVFGS